MTSYDIWLASNKEDMKDLWESMGMVERHEEGGDFNTFCQGQYDNSL